MPSSYHMVVVNIIASAILGIGVLFYKFVYPKKKINLFVLLLLISILPIISIFRPGTYESGDFNIHIYRIITFYSSLKEGIFMPSWAADLNATYGNPLFIFNYNLPYYIISLLHFLGFSFITSTKLYLAFIMYFSGIAMYVWFNKLTENKLASFTASIFYLFSPYHLIDIHFRATLGESTVFLILPILFYTIINYYIHKKNNYLIYICLISALLFLAHPLLAIPSIGIAFLYCFFIFLTNRKTVLLINTLLSLGLGVLGASYLWIPFLLFSNFTFSGGTPNLYFYPFNYLFYSPWRLGFLFQGPKGELQLIIGYTQILIVIISLIILGKNLTNSKIRHAYIFWVSVFLLLLFFLNPISIFIWIFFPLLWMLLPYGRLLLLISFSTSIIAGYFTIFCQKFKRGQSLILILIIVTILYSILNWGHRKVIEDLNDDYLIKNVPYSTINEGLTAYFLNNKWADANNFWFDKIPKNHLEIINGVGFVRQISRSSISHKYEINAKTSLKVKENTLFFPGWKLRINNKEVPIYPGERGIINADLPIGKYEIELKYEDIFVYKLSKFISIIFFSTLIFMLSFFSIVSRRFNSKP